jgi:hypothetical protein
MQPLCGTNLHSYNIALDEQPRYPPLTGDNIKLLSGLLFAVGSTLVVTSMWALGVTGTYLGKFHTLANLQLHILFLLRIIQSDFRIHR